MNHSLIPSISAVSLACMIAAGASHWWSVNQVMVVFDATGTPPRAMAMAAAADPAPRLAEAPDAPPAHEPAIPAIPAASAPSQAATAQVVQGEPSGMQQQFYQELIREMQQLRSQNHDLLNQVAETNRDIMKLEFRVDTHSEQFRPLPVSEDTFGTTFGTSFDDGPGLLPPRAEPVVLPFAE